MTSRSVGIEHHPDIQELRERYEVAGQRPMAQGVDGLIGLAGLFLAVSPWVVGFSGRTNLAVNDLIIGIAVALLAVGFASAYGRTHGMAWVAPVIGLWAIASPWAVSGPAPTASVIWSNVVTGALIVLFGCGAMAVGMLRR
ncbi:SPW repeat protein [Actinomadura viridis]|uniref:SPW repeat-containing integral membrane domain-containing protein n=1 Tax=Actinomadura viridis TaxID=58110 RepID=A0A931DC10_9ACTN|nr:SPW repeat protein [Actinomadura viridis]MBG6086109.1 hypothetical protein [Actinomadura viridis]